MFQFQHRYVPVAWGEIAPSDLKPQGDPESELTYRYEQHLGLYIRGVSGGWLGRLAVRCERDAYGEFVPVGCAITDTYRRIVVPSR